MKHWNPKRKKKKTQLRMMMILKKTAQREKQNHLQKNPENSSSNNKIEVLESQEEELEDPTEDESQRINLERNPEPLLKVQKKLVNSVSNMGNTPTYGVHASQQRIQIQHRKPRHHPSWIRLHLGSRQLRSLILGRRSVMVRKVRKFIILLPLQMS